MSPQVLYLEWQPCPPGTLAFLTDEESLLLKVAAGWQYVMVRKKLAVTFQVLKCDLSNNERSIW